MPRIFLDKYCVNIGKPVTLMEVTDILRKMTKDMSPGPDKWTVEFYLQYFDLMGPEIVRLVGEARSSGVVMGRG